MGCVILSCLFHSGRRNTRGGGRGGWRFIARGKVQAVQYVSCAGAVTEKVAASLHLECRGEKEEEDAEREGDHKPLVGCHAYAYEHRLSAQVLRFGAELYAPLVGHRFVFPSNCHVAKGNLYSKSERVGEPAAVMIW
jgi:hypothetical protein